MMQDSLTEKLAKHVLRPVDNVTKQRARLHLLDWLACVAGARQSALANMARNNGAIDVFAAAALLGNLLEMDDVHRSSILHPGPVVWATLFAQKCYDMDAMLEAAVRGYEAIIAIGSTFDSAHYAFHHNTATAGIFGAAVATADLGGCSNDQLTSAMGLAGSISAGLWQMRHETGDTKQWHIERAVVNGSAAAKYAAIGMKGPRFILEGPQGIYSATCKKPKPMLFPDQWRIHDVSFKPWGACRHAHPAIDAALELKRKLGHLDGDILVETYGDAIIFCDRPKPKTTLDAKFSIQHALAIVAKKDEPELADFGMDAVEAYAETRSRITLREASDTSLRYPEHYGARITCGGETIDLKDTLGDPERPMSQEQIIGKLRALVEWGGLPPREADRAADLALRGDDSSAIRAMLKEWLS